MDGLRSPYTRLAEQKLAESKQKPARPEQKSAEPALENQVSQYFNQESDSGGDDEAYINQELPVITQENPDSSEVEEGEETGEWEPLNRESDSTRFSTREMKTPGWFADYVIQVKVCTGVYTPENIKEAISREDSVWWKLSMDEEMENLSRNNT